MVLMCERFLSATQRNLLSFAWWKLAKKKQKKNNSTWQESTFTNCIHPLKASDQLEWGAISKARNENTNRRVWCLTTMNAFIEALSFLFPSVTTVQLLWHFFFSVFETDKARWSKCRETNGEPPVWSFDLRDWKVLPQRTNDDSSHCSSLYHYQPLSTLFSKPAHVLHVPTLYRVSRTKRKKGAGVL